MSHTPLESATHGLRVWMPAPTAPWGVVSAVALGVLVGAYDIKVLGALAVAITAVISVVWPSVAASALLVITFLFEEGLYGLIDPVGVFRLHRFGASLVGLNIDEILTLAAVIGLLLFMARRRAVAPLPMSMRIASLLFVGVFASHAAIELWSGTSPLDVFASTGGKYLVLLAGSTWVLTDCLQRIAPLTRVIDLFFLGAGGRAVFALIRYFLYGGDPANPYRLTVQKVALFESTDHMLFALMIAIALASLVLRAEAPSRRAWWCVLSLPMIATIVLSFRRTSLLGLVLVALAIGVLLWRKGGGRSVLAGAGASAAALAAAAAVRFQGSGSWLERLLPDVAGASDATRLTEWVLAFVTIRRGLFLGLGPLAERAAGMYDWSARIVHNAFLFVWMKIGLVGLSAFVVFIGTPAVRCTRRAIETEPDYRAVALTAMIPYLLVELMTGTPLIEARHTVAIALVLALMLVVSSGREVAHDF